MSRFRIVKLEERITPNLTLPSGKVVFSGFDNPAPGVYHPAVSQRSLTAVYATEATGNPTTANPLPYGNEGPWSAHIVQHPDGPIYCTEAGCPEL